MFLPAPGAFLCRLSCSRHLTRNRKNAVNLLSENLRALAVDRRSVHNVSTESSTDEPNIAGKEKVSKAMRAYIERAKKHDEFMKTEEVEFAIGKRHLANMMGMNPETITQTDIDKCIEYLFPSGLYDPKARPQMRPPKEVFPQRKAAEFDASGRPFHSFFYTSKPNFYQLLYDCVTAMKECDKREDAARRENQPPEPLDITGSVWLSLKELEQASLESLSERHHGDFIRTFERLAAHPFAYVAKDIIFKYRKMLSKQADKLIIPKPEYDTDGRPMITVKDCMRKTARGEVTLRGNGTGIITINGKDISYFSDDQAREQHISDIFDEPILII